MLDTHSRGTDCHRRTHHVPERVVVARPLHEEGVLVQAHARHAHQLRRDVSETFREGEGPQRLVAAPGVEDLLGTVGRWRTSRVSSCVAWKF